jgi:hypothetical protein
MSSVELAEIIGEKSVTRILLDAGWGAYTRNQPPMALKNDPRLQPEKPEERPARRGATSQSRIEIGEPTIRRSLRSQYSEHDEPESR